MRPERRDRPESLALATPSAAVVLIPIALSGLASLGEQMIWIRLFSAGLGHEVPAVLGVLVGFLAGLALGARLGDRLTAAPGASATSWFIRLELVIGVWCLATAWLIPAVNDLAAHLLGPQPGVAGHWLTVLALPSLTLAPATVAMGATLPVLLRAVGSRPGEDPGVGRIYAANTCGAAAGALAGTFLLMPMLGLRGALLVCALIHLATAGFVLRFWPTVSATAEQPTSRTAAPPPRRSGRAQAPPASPAAPSSRPDSADLRPIQVVALAFFGGLLALGFELASLRGLAQALDNTAYTYAGVLSVYLAGTALGGAAYQRFLSRRPSHATAPRLLLGLAAATWLAAWVLRFMHVTHDRLRAAIEGVNWLADTVAGVVLVELSLAALVLGLPTALMGGWFSHLLTHEARRPDGQPGRLLLWNTLGCAAGAVAVTLWAVPALGVIGSLRGMGLVYGLSALLLPGPGRGFHPAATVAGAVVLAMLFPANAGLRRVPEGLRVLAEREGVLATAAVLQSADGHRTLRVNHRLQMGGTASALAQRREAHLPLLLHPAPRTALFIGPGTGITLGAALAHPNLTITAVEVLPEVVELMRHFQPENGGPFPAERVALHIADARRFVRTDTNRYDVVVADLFHPAQDGAGFLYTREHFAAIRQRLTDTGLFCQWLPLHQLDSATLKVIVRTFLEVYSEAQAYLLHFNVDIPVLGLVGGRGRPDLDAHHLERRLAGADLRPALRAVGLDKAIFALGGFAGDATALRSFAGEAPVATDLRPRVLFLAPRQAARRNPAASATLFDWIDAPGARARSLTEMAVWREQPDWARTLDGFVRARDRYLHGLGLESSGNLRGAMDLYLESAGQSLYFTPAYARMVTILQVMAQADREQAREWWQRLEAARPDQPLGRQLLAPLFGTNTPSAQETAPAPPNP